MNTQHYSILDGFSVEILPREADWQVLLRAGLPTGSEVFLAHLPGHPFQGIITAASRLIDAGYIPVPHFCVRRWTDLQSVQGALGQLGEAGVERLLVLAGEAPAKDRLWDSSLEFLQSGIWQEMTPGKFFVAGHPEGMPQYPMQGVEILLAKQAFGKAHDVEMEIVSQFVLDADLFGAWDNELRMNGVHLPVRAGLPGKVTPATLAKYALRCGVGTALKASGAQKDRLLRLAGDGGMDTQIAVLQAQILADPRMLIGKVHFFPFGSLQNTLEWTKRHS